MKKLCPNATSKTGPECKALGVSMGDSWISADPKTQLAGGKTVIKKSVVGAKCQIGSGVKIEGSLLMDGVVVKNK